MRKTAYETRISDWSSCVLSSCLDEGEGRLPGAAVRRAVEALMPIAHAHDAAFILNDDPALAAELGCDGVHIGQEDASYQEARRLVADGIVGVTCHDSRHLAMEAADAGADYVAFGAFYPDRQRVGWGKRVSLRVNL